MKLSLLIAVCCTAALAANAQVNVTQKNNNPSRDGLYIDPAFTPGNAANLVRDLNFNGTIVGNVHAQPLYIEGGPNGPMIIAVTASNNIYALNATTGAVIWQRTDIGRRVRQVLRAETSIPTGTIGTPVVDLASRSLFFDALINGSSQQTFHLFVERGHRRHECGLAGGSERHRQLQRNSIRFPGAGRPRCTRSGERDRVPCLTPDTWGTAAIIMAGLSAWTSTILRMCMAGRQQRLAAAFGDTAALPATAPTCS